MKNIIFFDIDGTIYVGGSNGVHQEVIDAIHDTQRKGNLCFVCSGRPYGFIAQNIKDIGFDGYVLANGAQTVYQNKNIDVSYLEIDRVRQLINYFDKKDLQYVLATPDGVYLKKNFTYLWDFYKTCNIETDKFISDFDMEDIYSKVIKIEVYYKNKDNFNDIESIANDFFFMDQGASLVGELTRKDITKGIGIKNTLDNLSIDRSHSYCFGDGENDIEMFKAVAHPIAMENAIDEIKNLSEEICDSVENDGVAKKLEELF